ncbi:MAG TPA: ATPase [Candidatus Moranbacteria bacterium]|nr:ATPase [Candidatus Moranbacteria bacterium]
MENLIKNSRNLLKSVKTKKRRYLYDEIDFSQKMISIIGQRGVGKTTMLLQYLNERKNKDKQIYISLDDVFFLENSLKKTVETLYYDYGIRVFCIDEVHKYKNWNQELKNVYDLLPDIKILFSGSSSIDIIHGAYDLSRRVMAYNLYGLSFREFLEFKTNKNFDKIELADLLKKYQRYSVQLSSEINILKLFREYLEYGYYPYFLEGAGQVFETKLKNVLDKTIYEDIASLNNIKTENIYIFKRIMNFLASAPPGKININKLASALGIAFETAELYVDILHKITLIRYLLKDKKGYKLIRKTEKVFLDNTNLAIYWGNKLGLKKNIGMLRELFIVNQIQNINEPIFATEKRGDFFIKLNKKRYTFEIGGKSKDFKQISKIENSFLAVDDVEIAGKKKIPLYLFGFLY